MCGSGVQQDNKVTTSFYAPSFALERFEYGWYGVGHTARRVPGDMRGTAVGEKGRFRRSGHADGGDVPA
jgi:hypothetical protein